jgi:ankyrin repeat protein
MTALDMAILMGDVESTAQLLAAGADPDHLLKLFALTDLYEVTVLHPDKKKTKDLLADDDKVSTEYLRCMKNLDTMLNKDASSRNHYTDAQAAFNAISTSKKSHKLDAKKFHFNSNV